MASLLIWTVVLFDRVGEGTLGLGEVMGEPVHLVVRGPYQHVRNPMITGVLCILLGEAAITALAWLLAWFATFLVFQATAIRFWEEPHLAERYGSEYLDYRRNVPRWIPRISGWEPAR
ncbi:methyltransferase family protein [Mycobacterium noviomagense]|uniref:methyltransferase family protein n=1 Tax=Mycobacterium noviomagense TaxID=459858 RepID=UPI001E5E9AC8|nr:isoprenylcysteine carboxylmethyltransferase family protein [Mycobacterium noviomagense]